MRSSSSYIHVTFCLFIKDFWCFVYTRRFHHVLRHDDRRVCLGKLGRPPGTQAGPALSPHSQRRLRSHCGVYAHLRHFYDRSSMLRYRVSCSPRAYLSHAVRWHKYKAHHLNFLLTSCVENLWTIHSNQNNLTPYWLVIWLYFILNLPFIFLQNWWILADRLRLLLGIRQPSQSREASVLAAHGVGDRRSLRCPHGMGNHPPNWWATLVLFPTSNESQHKCL